MLEAQSKPHPRVPPGISLGTSLPAPAQTADTAKHACVPKLPLSMGSCRAFWNSHPGVLVGPMSLLPDVEQYTDMGETSPADLWGNWRDC